MWTCFIDYENKFFNTRERISYIDPSCNIVDVSIDILRNINWNKLMYKRNSIGIPNLLKSIFWCEPILLFYWSWERIFISGNEFVLTHASCRTWYSPPLPLKKRFIFNLSLFVWVCGSTYPFPDTPGAPNRWKSGLIVSCLVFYHQMQHHQPSTTTNTYHLRAVSPIEYLPHT